MGPRSFILKDDFKEFYSCDICATYFLNLNGLATPKVAKQEEVKPTVEGFFGDNNKSAKVC